MYLELRPGFCQTWITKSSEKLVHSRLFYFACVGIVNLTGTTMVLVDKIIRVIGPSHIDVVCNERHSLQD